MLERDHPIIENLMRTGYPTRETPKSPACPICHERCNEVYINNRLDIAGCDICVDTKDPDATETCEICGKPCDTIYTDDTDNVIGCENCVNIQDAWRHTEIYRPE